MQASGGAEKRAWMLPHTSRIGLAIRQLLRGQTPDVQLIANMLDAVVSPASTGRIER